MSDIPEVDNVSVGHVDDIKKFEEVARKFLDKFDLDVCVKLKPKAAFAANCSASGPGLKNGEVDIPSDFTIQARDNLGQPLNHGENPFSVGITAPDGSEVPATLKDNNDGTVEVQYTPLVAGPHKVEVKLGDTPIAESPMQVEVDPPTPDPTQCTAEGPGLEHAVVGQPAPFKITAKNKIGNPLKVGGHPFVAVLKDEHDVPVEAKVTDNKDGTYDAEYVPKFAADAKVHVTVGDKDIKDSPFPVKVDKNPDQADSEKSFAFGPGVEGGKECNTADPAVFTIQAVAPNGEKLKTGGSPFKADVTDASGDEVPCEVKDNGDGTYACKYQPKKPEKHTVSVNLHNPTEAAFFDPIKGSPYTVDVCAGVDASKCICEGPGLENGVPEDTKPATFVIKAKDILGQDVKEGGEPFVIDVKDPSGKPVKSNIKDNGDGTYDCTYEPDQPGPHEVCVTRHGKGEDLPVAQSPYKVDVIEGADDGNTSVGWYSFTVQAKNKKGEPMTRGGDRVEVEIKCDAQPAPVEGVETKDNGDGTYTTTYRLEEPGKYLIHINMNGRKLKGSPIRQTLA